MDENLDDIGNDDDVDINELVNTDLINLMGGLFSSAPPPDPLRDAAKSEDYDLAKMLINDGADPFSASTTVWDPNGVSAFQEVSAQGNIEMLLAMAALPGCVWNQRFLLSRNAVLDAPTRGRSCIPNASSCSGNFFHSKSHTSMESLEVMMMFGYHLKRRDFEYSLIPLAFVDRNMRALKFAVASEGSLGDLKLEQCLGMAIGGNHGSFIRGTHPTSFNCARMLLKLGADPNGYCFQGDTPYDFIPALFQAVQNKDEEMTSLLMAYGADSSRVAQFSSWTAEDELDIEEVPIAQKAKENNMSHLLVPPKTLMAANPDDCIKEFRRELEAPLKQIVPEYSGALIVAVMRATGNAPPVGLMSRLMLAYCPLGHDLWEISISYDDV